MSKKSDLQTLQEMATKPENVVVAAPTYIEVTRTKMGGTINFGFFAPEFTDKLMNATKYHPVLFLVDREEFTRIRNQEGGVES